MRCYKAEVVVVWRKIFWRLKMVEEEVWKFPKVGSKKQRVWYTPESVSHPAKMNTLLTRKLITTFTNPGDVVLDPMAGVGTTLVESMLLGRNVVAVDIEEKFCKLMEGNLENVKEINDKSKFKLRLGRAAVIKGDSRYLAQLLQDKMDAVVTSPPYSGAVNKHAGGDKVRERFEGFMGESQLEARKYSEDEANIGNLADHGKVDAVVTSPPYSEALSKRRKGYTKLKNLANTREYPQDSKDENIGNLRHGQVDTVITSPPFGEANRGSGIAKKGYEGKHGVDPKLHECHDRPLSDDPEQISNLQYGKSVDVVLTSPPYADGKKGEVSPERKAKDFEEHYVPEMGGKSFHTQQRLRGVKSLVSGYSDDPKNIGNLKLGEVDAVLTSPPYADGSKGRTRELFWDRLAKDPTSNRFGRKSHPHVGEGYSEEKENIGNLPHEGNVSAIITSPPYSEGLGHGRGRSKKLQEEKRLHLHGAGSYSEESEENIGEIRTHGAVDAVITSPPYEGSLEGTSRHTKGGIPSRDPKLGQTGTYADIVITSPPYEGSVNAPNDPNRRAERMRRAGLDPRTIVGGKARCGEIDWKYSENSQNIGNLKSDDRDCKTLKVYTICQKLTDVLNAVNHAIEELNAVPSATLDIHLTTLGSHLVKNIVEILVCIMQVKSLGIETGTKVATFLNSVDLIIQDGKVAKVNGGVLDGMQLEHYLMNKLGKSASFADMSQNTQQMAIKQLEPTILFPSKREGQTIFQIWFDYVLNAIQELRTKLMQEVSPTTEHFSNKSQESKKQSESYLQAMLQVYMEMFKVLKPGGLAIVVLKNFIRNWKVVDLIGDTVKLCEHVGFKLVRRIRFVLPQQSFWRVSYRPKYERKFKRAFPEEEFASVYKYETVLVFEKALIGSRKL